MRHGIGLTLPGLAGMAAMAAAAADPGTGPYHRYEWRASTFSVSSQSEAALAVDAGGNIFTAWSSRRQQSGRYGIYGQRFTPEGVAVGAETCLNLWTDSHQRTPDLAADPAGDVWVVWQSHGQDGFGGAIIARKLSRDAAGSEILVNEDGRGHEADPVVAAGRDGSVLVAWTSSAPGRGTRVRARLLSPAGSRLGEELEVAVRGATPAVAATPDGRYAIVYAVTRPDGRPAGIRARMHDPADAGLGEVIDVSAPGRAGAVEPVVAAAAGGLVVAWHEPDGDGYLVTARRLGLDGRPAGEAFVVDAGGGSQSGAAVAATPDGGFAVAYNRSNGDGPGVFAGLFGPDGTRRGERLRLNEHTEGTQTMQGAVATSRFAVSASGALVCVWSGDAGLGDGSSANVSVLSPRVLETADRGVTEGMAAAADPDTTSARPHEPPIWDPQSVAEARREKRSGPEGTGFTGIVNTGWTPPDPHMGAGPDHVVLVTNGAIAFFQKDGTQTFQDQIEGAGGFWGGLGATGFVFDPEALYDELSGRFFVMAAEAFAPGNRSYVLVGVSDDSDPNGTWHKYRFETTALAGDLFDSPNLGVDDEAVYITGDGFGLGANYPLFIFDKASLLAGSPPAVSHASTIPTFTQSAGLPPVTYDDPPALYLIEHKESSTNFSVRLLAIQDPLTTPSITTTTLTVPAYGPPEDPPQMGTTARPETFDARFWNVAYRNGSLWATHHINADRVLARWYEIAMNGWPDSGMLPALVQSGEIDPGPGVRTFFTAITVDDHGNAAMTYARSSPAEFISMETAYRYASDPLGTFPLLATQQTNTSAYTTTRWGDYGSVQIDPADGISVWAHHEYAIGGSWQTWVAGFTPAFDAADLDLDGSVGILDFLALLAAWGPCPEPCPPVCPGDIDGDCTVGILDLLALLASWG